MHVSPLETNVKVRNGRIQITKMTKANIVMRLVLWALLLFTLIGPFLLDYGTITWSTAISLTLGNLKMMFLEPAFHQITFATALKQISITLALAFLATILGAVLSFFLAIFSAKNLVPSMVSNGIIAFNSFIRAVPTVLWVLIFAIVAGLGAIACVLGMMLHTIAYLTKAFAESFEELEEGTIEALRAQERIGGILYGMLLFRSLRPIWCRGFFYALKRTMVWQWRWVQRRRQVVLALSYLWLLVFTMIYTKLG
ncbi:hypothetical protein LSPH26S_04541 [Lysinibacillus sphaericus]